MMGTMINLFSHNQSPSISIECERYLLMINHINIQMYNTVKYMYVLNEHQTKK